MSALQDLSSVSKQLGGNAKVSLVKKEGRLKKPLVESAEDIVGFDVIISTDGTAYKFYAANPPLTGMTQPKPVKYPLGLASFDDYKIDYSDAVDIFHKGNWGSKFSSIIIDKPLHPSVDDPFWYIVSDTDVHVAINANTGEANVQ